MCLSCGTSRRRRPDTSPRTSPHRCHLPTCVGGRSRHRRLGFRWRRHAVAAVRRVEAQSQLAARPDVARAWAQIVGVDVSGISSYLDTLRPQLITAPFRSPITTTNPGSRGNCSQSLMSALRYSSTARVFPCVRCACGNPLKPAKSRPPRSVARRTDSMPPVLLRRSRRIFSTRCPWIVIVRTALGVDYARSEVPVPGSSRTWR